MIKLLYKPVNLIASMLGGLIAGLIFKRVWEIIGRGDDVPKPTDERPGWGEILLAAFAPSARLVHARGSRHRPQDFPVQGSREAPARRAAWRAAVSMNQIVSVA